MCALLYFVLAVLASQFKSKSRLEAENAALRHQLIVLRRKVHGCVHLTNNDRWFLVQLYRWFPSILQALTIIRPETLVRTPCSADFIIITSAIIFSVRTGMKFQSAHPLPSF
jgi:hypothetical protein